MLPDRSDRRPLVLLLLVAAAGCGGAQPPRWQRLTRVPSERRGTSEFVASDGREFRLLEDAAGQWSEASLPLAVWKAADPVRGVWVTPVPVVGRGSPRDGGPPWRLTGGGCAYEPLDGLGGIAAAGPGSFVVGEDAMALRLEPGTEPPDDCRLAIFAGRPEDGRRVAGRRFSGEGLAVWPGQEVICEVDLSEPRALSFATTCEPVIAGPSGGLSVIFRVLLEDEVVFEGVQVNARSEGATWHRVELSAAGAHATLRFEVQGALARTAFLAPVLGPLEVGTWGERPWEARRPDVVVFLADTFRADNLTAYGGTHGLTPYLDRLAERSLVFRRAWSVSTYTMPAHSSMFTGYYARQAWGTTDHRALPDGLTTIAEHLAEHGYRTGAVTGSTIVSQVKGLAQGFEWFDELRSGMSSTAERVNAFLDADDGRPVFLFVHSYRVHAPYRITRASQRRHGEALGLDRDFNTASDDLDALYREVGAVAVSDTHRHKLQAVARVIEEGGATEGQRARYEALVRSFRAQYLGGVADFDVEFRALHKGLQRRGILERGYFLFLSDHGEAFMEHDRAFHGGKAWEELGRVPLMLSGPGVEPGFVDHAASLLDFAPTIADLAGVAPLEGWLGTSLLTLDRERPVFLFENQNRDDSTFAVVDGARKAFGLEDLDAIRAGRCTGAYDLARDRGEARDLAHDASWPRELLLEVAPRVETYMTPVVEPEGADLDAAKLEELRAMGYVGD